MKTILCYGDSLTFGADPAVDGGRHPFESRWPNALGAALGADKVRIIPEGLGGRTTAYDDMTALADRNGARVLPTLIASHTPLDAVIIMLGTNDMKPNLCGTAHGAAMGMSRLAEIVRTYPYGQRGSVPDVILVSPPPCVPTEHANLSPMFDGGVEESQLLAKYYAMVAQDSGCGFFDAGTVAKASPLDGVHLDAESTAAIGKGLAPLVAERLGL